MSKDEFEISELLPIRLAVLSERVSNMLHAVYDESRGFSVTEWLVLAHLFPLDRISVRDIQIGMNLETPRVSRAVTRLEAAGLVRRESRSDRLNISLTEAGQEVQAAILPAAQEIEARFLADVSEADFAVFGRVMETMQGVLDADPGVRAHEDAAEQVKVPEAEAFDLPVTLHRRVPRSWTDYNGHMNEAYYVEVSGKATDRFMEMIGCDAAYIASGGSFFTVENHICYLAEVLAGEALTVTTQVLSGEGKKMHLFHRLLKEDGTISATVETLLIHIDMTIRRSGPPGPEVAERLRSYAKAHAGMPRPEQAGRFVGKR